MTDKKIRKGLEDLTEEEIEELALTERERRNVLEKIAHYLNGARVIASAFANSKIAEYCQDEGRQIYTLAGSATFGDFEYNLGKKISHQSGYRRGAFDESEYYSYYIITQDKDSTLSYKNKIVVSDGQISKAPYLHEEGKWPELFEKLYSAAIECSDRKFERRKG